MAFACPSPPLVYAHVWSTMDPREAPRIVSSALTVFNVAKKMKAQRISYCGADLSSSIDAMLVAHVIETSKTLRSVDISCCELGHNGVMCIISAMSKCPTLEEANLRNNKLKHVHYLALLKAMANSDAPRTNYGFFGDGKAPNRADDADIWEQMSVAIKSERVAIYSRYKNTDSLAEIDA